MAGSFRTLQNHILLAPDRFEGNQRMSNLTALVRCSTAGTARNFVSVLDPARVVLPAGTADAVGRL
jgi:hypothetical protein